MHHYSTFSHVHGFAYFDGGDPANNRPGNVHVCCVCPETGRARAATGAIGQWK
jgi:hypothetical protein